MIWFLLRRLLLGIPLVVIVIAFTFALIHLAPGDPAFILAGDAPTPEFLALVRSQYDLDKPAMQQFLIYMQHAIGLDFGTSIYFGRPVVSLILERLPATLLLTVISMVVAAVLGVQLGVTAARYRGTRLDALISMGSLVGYSIPTFWLGQLLILVFAVMLGWLPAGGFDSVRIGASGFDHSLDVATHLVLPVATLALFELGLVSRFTRIAMIDALNKDYVTVAYAKGATTERVLWRHALPNAILTTITIIGLEFGALMAGAVAVETIFGWPGLGRLFYEAVFRRDFPLLTGCFIFVSAAVVIVNIMTDLLYAACDPRVTRRA